MTNDDFKNFILEQLTPMGQFDSKNMFGGTALLINGKALAKIKHGTLWLKVDDSNRDDFIAEGMPQYTYGKDGSRKLNFYEAPADVIEDTDKLREWVAKAMEVAKNAK